MQALPDDVFNKADLLAAAEAAIDGYDNSDAAPTSHGEKAPLPDGARRTLKSFLDA